MWWVGEAVREDICWGVLAVIEREVWGVSHDQLDGLVPGWGGTLAGGWHYQLLIINYCFIIISY